MQPPPYDPRAVANLLLDLATESDEGPLRVSNLALQKLLYFAHGHFLIRTGRPLVSGAFEAWTYGPVHPAVYACFKSEEDRPIEIRAVGRNPMTGAPYKIVNPDDGQVRAQLRDVLRAYGKLSVGRLVEISHASKGPWETIVNKAKTSVALGLRIPDNIIVDRFKFHKVTIGPQSRVGEPNEDTPIAGD